MSRKTPIVILLVATLLGNLCSCGIASTSQSGISADEDSPNIVVESEWAEEVIDYSGMTFVQKQVDVPASIAPSGLKTFDNGFLYVTNNLRTHEAIYGTTDEALNIVSEYSLGTATEQSAIAYFDAMGETAYFIRCDYEQDSIQSDSFTQSYILSQYDLSGSEKWELALDDNFGERESADQLLVTGVAALPDGGALITTQHYVYWISRDGTVAASIPTDGAVYMPVRSKDGTAYLVSSDSGTNIHPIDNGTHTIGAPILSCSGNTTVMTGSGEYDFLLKTDAKLSGVSLETSTITELLSWSKCGVTEIPTIVFCMGTNQWWVVGYNIISDESQLIELSCVPEDEVAQKQAVMMAVPIDTDLTAEDTLGYEEFSAISEFNATNEAYSLEYASYSSSEDLQLMFLSGDVPDLLMFSSTVHQGDVPSEQLFAKKGYFLDIETFISSDLDISLDMFVPGIIETQKSTLGGLYTLPTCVNYKMMYGRTEYVGTTSVWSIPEFDAVLATVGSEMSVVPYTSNSEFLKNLLEVELGAFVDFQTMTCDFESDDFSTLLQICKTYLPSEPSQDECSVEDGSALLDYISTLGGVGQMAERIATSSAYASVKGFPGISGSGGAFTAGKTYAICAGSTAPEGAWAYLKTLLSDSYQENCIAPYIPVMLTAYNQENQDWLDAHPDSCNEEMIQAVTEMLAGTRTRCLFDSPALDIILDEAAAYFNDMQSLETTCSAIQSRVQIFLSEQT